MLFLEDLSPLTPVDQVTGWTVDQAKVVLETASHLHATYWGMAKEAGAVQACLPALSTNPKR